MSFSYPVPSTPRVISPSPTPSELSEAGRDTYFAPSNRPNTKQPQRRSPKPISEEKDDASSDSSLEKRARTRSRSPVLEAAGPGYSRKRRMSGMTAVNSGKKSPTKSESSPNGHPPKPSEANGSLSPYSYSTIQNRWREFSRSPSPLGLIPLHRHYRNLIHKHEIPRKALHVSIGFMALSFYTNGLQTTAITPWLFGALIPIAATDYLRHRFSGVNRVYIKCLGALMRETEVDGWNGVVWYLLGAYIALKFFPKDIGVMGVLLLSWCDTAASTFGRLYGRYTIRLRSGKSLAGTLAAFLTGLLTAVMFWGWLAPRTGTFPDDPAGGFMFTGELGLPHEVTKYLGWDPANARIGGAAALGLMGVWTGLVASFSEFVDVLGWDDNLTIPVLSSIGMWGFLKLAGA